MLWMVVEKALEQMEQGEGKEKMAAMFCCFVGMVKGQEKGLWLA